MRLSLRDDIGTRVLGEMLRPTKSLKDASFRGAACLIPPYDSHVL